jgi:hypothetical protein
MKPGFASEVELGRVVVAWLRAQGYTVYQEAGPDVVAVRDGASWAVELKLGFGFEVLAQADQWRGQAARVSIATPPVRLAEVRVLAEEVLRWRGLGWLMVYGAAGAEFARPRPPVVEHVAAAAGPVRRSRVIDQLRPEMQTYSEAGNPGARRFTAFKGTVAAVQAAVVAAPGVPLKDLVRSIGHHYPGPAAARSGIRSALDRGLIPGVVGRVEGGLLRLYPATLTEAGG